MGGCAALPPRTRALYPMLQRPGALGAFIRCSGLRAQLRGPAGARKLPVLRPRVAATRAEASSAEQQQPDGKKEEAGTKMSRGLRSLDSFLRSVDEDEPATSSSSVELVTDPHAGEWRGARHAPCACDEPSRGPHEGFTRAMHADRKAPRQAAGLLARASMARRRVWSASGLLGTLCCPTHLCPSIRAH